MSTMEVVVLAGGSSVRRLPGFPQVLERLPRRYRVVAVNDAALHAPAHVILSMDRMWAENRLVLAARRYIGVGRPAPPILLRRGVLQPRPEHVIEHRTVQLFDCDHREDAPISHTPGQYNGDNSGACALNYALQLQPRRVLMLGFDMQPGADGRQHWYEDWTVRKAGRRRMVEWSRRFDRIIAPAFQRAGVELVNVTNRSLIPEEVVARWTPGKFVDTL